MSWEKKKSKTCPELAEFLGNKGRKVPEILVLQKGARAAASQVFSRGWNYSCQGKGGDLGKPDPKWRREVQLEVGEGKKLSGQALFILASNLS